MSEKLIESIVNSKDKLAGLPVAVPAQPKTEWRVSRIGFKDVELQSRRVTYSKGKREEETDTLVTFQERPDRIVRITQGDLTLEIVE